MLFYRNDGGRTGAGYEVKTKDCVYRAIAIAMDIPYQNVHSELNDLIASHRNSKQKKMSSAKSGVFKRFYTEYLINKGWSWVPCMGIGTGCQVHLKASELPMSRLIVRVSKHLTAVIDGVLNDTHDCSRNETRCVYGYFIKK